MIEIHVGIAHRDKRPLCYFTFEDVAPIVFYEEACERFPRIEERGKTIADVYVEWWSERTNRSGTKLIKKVEEGEGDRVIGIDVRKWKRTWKR